MFTLPVTCRRGGNGPTVRPLGTGRGRASNRRDQRSCAGEVSNGWWGPTVRASVCGAPASPASSLHLTPQRPTGPLRHPSGSPVRRHRRRHTHPFGETYGPTPWMTQKQKRNVDLRELSKGKEKRKPRPPPVSHHQSEPVKRPRRSDCKYRSFPWRKRTQGRRGRGSKV